MLKSDSGTGLSVLQCGKHGWPISLASEYSLPISLTIQRSLSSEDEVIQPNDQSSDEGVGLLGLVPPGGGKRLHITVVTGESVDSALGQNESEFGILVLSALLQVLSDVNSLLDQMVEVFWDLWGEALLLQDSEDFASSDRFNLRDSVTISESNTDLRWGATLLGELDNLLNEIVVRDLNPAGCRLPERKASTCDTLSV